MNPGEILVKKIMWFDKKNCSICHKKLYRSKLNEYETIEGRKILCCLRCSNFIKKKQK